MRAIADLKANYWPGTVTITLPRQLIDALKAARVHRDEGPTVVTIKCAGFEDAEDLGGMLTDAQRFIRESERED